MRVALALASGVLAAGCSTQPPSWIYQPNSYQGPKAVAQKVAIVIPFEDKRPNNNTELVLLAMLPLVPYASNDYQVPHFEFTPTYDFAQGLVQELAATGRYKDVYLSGKGMAADYDFTGQILTTEVKLTVITYGLSGAGEFLWLIGLPAVISDRDLSLRLGCSDVKTSKVVFEETYSIDHLHAVFGIYNKAEPNYPGMIKELYGKFIADLASKGKCL